MAQGAKTGGRQKGTPNKANSAKVKAIQASGLMPLDYMLEVLRDLSADQASRIDAAKAAAPYLHSKMPVALEHAGKNGAELTIQLITRTVIDASPNA